MIFLDNASTSKLCPPALAAAIEMGEKMYFNPSALYGEALKVKNAIEESRAQLASMLGIESDELYFTSCATESNNWAFEKGVKNKKGNIVVTKGEHASVYESALVQKSKGIDVRFVSLNKDGSVDIDDLCSKIDENTCFASIIHLSNETGAINDLQIISRRIREINPRVIIHSDGVQAFAKEDTNLKKLGVDMYSISAHKVGGLKGCGALYLRKGIHIAPLIAGGGQERGLRSGTENVVGIVGFAAAAKYTRERYDSEKIKEMRAAVISTLMPLGIKVNGNADGAILSISAEGIKAEVLQHMLSDRGVLIGLGSACSSRSRNNRVLSAIGLSAKEIEGSIRISFGIDNDLEQAITAAKIIKEQIITLRGNIR